MLGTKSNSSVPNCTSTWTERRMGTDRKDIEGTFKNWYNCSGKLAIYLVETVHSKCQIKYIEKKIIKCTFKRKLWNTLCFKVVPGTFFSLIYSFHYLTTGMMADSE